MFLGPAIVRKTPAEFKVFLHKPFWGGIAGNRLELINQSRLIIITVENQKQILNNGSL